MNIAINTGGGDAPGLNAAIRAATLAALKHGWNVYGIRNGYGSLFTDEPFLPLKAHSVLGITFQGGTILGTASQGNPFDISSEDGDGNVVMQDGSNKVVERFKEYNIDALVAIGGDGSMAIANKLAQKRINIVGIPKTIDNDIYGCNITLGFDTAVTTATEAIDKILQQQNRITV
jgi:6-phosphofructokinase 1